MANGLATYNGQDFVMVTDREGFPFTRHVTELQLREDGYFLVFTNTGKSYLLSPYTNSTGGYDFKQEEFPNSIRRIPGPAATPPLFYHDPSNQLFGPDLHTRIDSISVLLGAYQPTPWGTILSLDPQAGEVTEFDTTGAVVRQFALPSSTAWSHRPNFFLEGKEQFIYYASVFPEIQTLEEMLWSLNKEGAASPISLKKDGKPIPVKDVGDFYSYRKFILKRGADQNLWLVTNDRLWVFDQGGEMIADLSEKLNEFVGAAWTPTHFFTDSAENFWLSTNAGIFLISTHPEIFKTYLQQERNTSVRGIIELDNGNILVGTYQNNREVDLLTGNTSLRGSSLEKSCFNAFHRMESGEILIGVYGPQVTALQDNVFLDRGDVAGSPPFLIPYYYSAAKTYFFGSSEGLYSSVAYDLNFLPYPEINGFDLIRSSTITHFHETLAGLWVGGSNGLFLLHPKKGIIRSALSKYHIKHFYVDDEDIFWVATATTGLLRWNPVTDDLRSYTLQDGLTNNTLYAVYQDDNGYLWLPSNKGLMRLNPADGDVISFQPEDGIAHEEFNTYSHYEASDGTLYFGGLDGLTCFHPSSINLKKYNAPLRLNSLTQYVAATDKIENRTAEILHDGVIRMNPGDKSFFLTFNLLDYVSNNISYAWKIDGVFNDWNYQKENSIRMFSLPYGNHSLRIKARSSGTGWIERELVIPVIVRRPFYRSLPFLLSLPLLLGLLTFWIVRYRTARLRIKSLHLQQVVAERTKELAIKNQELQTTNSTKDRLFAMIAHDLRAPLLTLRGLTKKVNFLIERDRIPEVRQIGRTVDGAVDRTQKLLDNLLSWAIVQGEGFKYRPEKLFIRELFEEIQALYQDTAKSKSIHLKIVLSDQVQVVYADKRSMLTILRNLVDNAIKFTPQGGRATLTSSLAGKKDMVRIQITDNGIGMSERQIDHLFTLDHSGITPGTTGEKGTGLGLVLCADLSRQNGGRLSVQSTLAEGTTFSLLIPTHKR